MCKVLQNFAIPWKFFWSFVGPGLEFYSYDFRPDPIKWCFSSSESVKENNETLNVINVYLPDSETQGAENDLLTEGAYNELWCTHPWTASGYNESSRYEVLKQS